MAACPAARRVPMRTPRSASGISAACARTPCGASLRASRSRRVRGDVDERNPLRRRDLHDVGDSRIALEFRTDPHLVDAATLRHQQFAHRLAPLDLAPTESLRGSAPWRPGGAALARDLPRGGPDFDGLDPAARRRAAAARRRRLRPCPMTAACPSRDGRLAPLPDDGGLPLPDDGLPRPMVDAGS